MLKVPVVFLQFPDQTPVLGEVGCYACTQLGLK